MEDKKDKSVKTKTVNMSSEKTKLTYEELNDAAVQLSQQNQSLRQELTKLSNMLNQANRQNNYAELGFRFRVIENSDKFPKEFTEAIKNEIVEFMTYKEETSIESNEVKDK